MPTTHHKIIGSLGELQIRRDGKPVALAKTDMFYDPSQPRDAKGQWSKGGGSGGAAGGSGGSGFATADGGTMSVSQILAAGAEYQSQEYFRAAEVLEGAWKSLPYVNPDPETMTVDLNDEYASVTGELTKDGKYVGTFGRTLTNDGSIMHDVLEIAPSMQGQGIGSEFLHASEEMYRQVGIDRITLIANIDVGGYAWAKAGFDFINPTQGVDILNEISRYDDASPTFWDDVDAAMAKANKFEESDDEADAPTAFEISRIGWTPGATTWPGKELMLGAKWPGDKAVAPASAALTETMFYDPGQPRAADGKWTKGGGSSGVGRKAGVPQQGPDERAGTPVPDRGGYLYDAAGHEVAGWTMDDGSERTLASILADAENEEVGISAQDASIIEENFSMTLGESVSGILASASMAYYDKDTKEPVYQSDENGEYYDPGTLLVSGRLESYDEESGDSEDIGQFSRAFSNNGDKVWVKHALLTINEDSQGQGIGSEFLRESEAFYRDVGVDTVTLDANIDVGGYAWARSGFDFNLPEEARVVLQHGINKLERDGVEVPQQLRTMLADAEKFDYASESQRATMPAPPTAFELSEFGRTPGATTWVGKQLMLDSSWSGSKTLPPPEVPEWVQSRRDGTNLSEASVIEMFYDPGQPRAADGKWTKGSSAARKAAYVAAGHSPEVARQQVTWEDENAAEEVRIQSLRAIPITGGKITLPREIWEPIAADEVMALRDGISHDYPEVVEATVEAMAGEFERRTGAVEVSTNYGQGYVEIEGKLAEEGAIVAGFKRTVIDDGEKLVVTHNILQINGSEQGQGTGSKFLKDSEELYASWGGAEVQLNANIDVGGYAWARLGFDFMDPSDGRKFLSDIAIDYMNEGKGLPPEIMVASERFKAAERGEGSAPTAFELSQWGRTPGATDWPGKRALLGGKWDGYKVIPGA